MSSPSGPGPNSTDTHLLSMSLTSSIWPPRNDSSSSIDTSPDRSASASLKMVRHSLLVIFRPVTATATENSSKEISPLPSVSICRTDFCSDVMDRAPPDERMRRIFSVACVWAFCARTARVAARDRDRARTAAAGSGSAVPMTVMVNGRGTACRRCRSGSRWVAAGRMLSLDPDEDAARDDLVGVGLGVLGHVRTP